MLPPDKSWNFFPLIYRSVKFKSREKSTHLAERSGDKSRSDMGILMKR
jgi:hypothetical protein